MVFRPPSNTHERVLGCLRRCRFPCSLVKLCCISCSPIAPDRMDWSEHYPAYGTDLSFVGGARPYVACNTACIVLVAIVAEMQCAKLYVGRATPANMSFMFVFTHTFRLYGVFAVTIPILCKASSASAQTTSTCAHSIHAGRSTSSWRMSAVASAACSLAWAPFCLICCK